MRLLLFVFVFLISALEAQDYFPHAVGNKWIYSDSLIAEIIGTATLTNGTPVFKFRRLIESQGETDTSFYYQGVSGNTISLYNTLTASSGAILLKSPYTVGTTWPDQGSDAGLMDSLKIVSINETVFVPAGNFSDCIKVKVFNVNNAAYVWYAPNVGFVKIENTGTCDGGCGDKQLVSYTIHQ